MKRYLFFLLAALAASTLWAVVPDGETPDGYVQAKPLATHKILFIPLDSRPQCMDFVSHLAKIADFEILAPPRQLLGDDCEFARPYRIRRWLEEHSEKADAAILSIDMLVHGGLLPSRINAGTQTDIDAALQLLRALHKERPQLTLYVFHIIPRMAVADTPDTFAYRDDLLEYSALTEKIYTFGQSEDIEARRRLEKRIPAGLLAKYHKLYHDNAQLNAQLLALVKEGVLTKLIVGQDDGEIFGIPNTVKQSFLNCRRSLGLNGDKAAMTRGADEVAQTLLCSVYPYVYGFGAPRVFVMYNAPQSAAKIMPYMPCPVEETIREKIYLSGAVPTLEKETADFILYVHIGAEATEDARFASAKTVKRLLQGETPVALVDLSEDFQARQTLFPVLLANNAPVNRLIAYAGWNTTSNAAGTALAQAILFTEQKKRLRSGCGRLRLYTNNLAFLNSRFLEDFFYLKQSIDILNTLLEKEDIDPYHLGDKLPLANDALQKLFEKDLHRLTTAQGWQAPLCIPTNEGTLLLKPKGLDAAIRFPWHRTFEVDITLNILLQKR